VLDKLNEPRREDQKLTAQYLGKKLRAMGIKTRISNGRSHICMDEANLKTLLVQFYVSEESGENSPNSPNGAKSSTCDGESGDSYAETRGNSPESHRPQTLDALGGGEFGESGDDITPWGDEDNSQQAAMNFDAGSAQIHEKCRPCDRTRRCMIRDSQRRRDACEGPYTGAPM
jgi:hypothetical protein